MRELSESFKNHLQSETTTLCQCWKIERKDGLIQGFTDHDDVLVIEGVRYQPQSGFNPSEAVSNLGLGVDTSEVEGALQSDMISENALQAGDYDNARVTIYAVNWRESEQFTIMHVADLGEVTLEDGLFRAELRGLMHQLNQVQGRLFENTCPADLGDRRCQVNLENPAFKGMGDVITLLDSQTFQVDGLLPFENGWFDRGLLTWVTGANAGRQIEIESQFQQAGKTQIRLWLPMPSPIAEGDRFEIIAGCDKLFPTCQQKFNNSINFRGFPHIPGNDFAYRFARSGRANDGSPIIR